MYKKIIKVLEKAWEFGIKVTEIELTEEQARDLMNDLGTPVGLEESVVIETLNTDYGEVRIVIE